MRPRLLAAGAAVAALLTTGPAVVAQHACDDRRLYRWCGEYPDGAGLPLRFHVSSAHASAAAFAELLRAVGDEIGAWNQAWQVARAAVVGPAQPNACGSTGPLMCVIGVTGAQGTSGDGINTIAFRPGLAGTCGAGSGSLAVTCLVYAGETGAASHRIVEADVFLDPTVDLRSPRVEQLAAGDQAWVYPGPMPAELCTPRWADLWSVLAHELGHAAGLEHIRSAFPGDLTDVHPMRQTMWDTYRWCSTHQRSLADGDVLGLIEVARAVVAAGG